MIRCPKDDSVLTIVNTDSRQEWTEEEYECPECELTAVRRTEYDQNGLTTKDEVTYND